MDAVPVLDSPLPRPATDALPREELEVSAADASVLRALAGRVAAIAQSPAEEEKRIRWCRHNDLKAERPLVFCFPERGWEEIIPEHALRCTGRLARAWEFQLRQELFWGEEMGDDRVIEPFFDLPHVFTETGWGMEETRHHTGAGGAYAWEAPLRHYDQLDNLRFPRIVPDLEATGARLALAGEVFGDRLRVRLRTQWFWTAGLSDTLARLRGLEQLMLDMYDEPENLHRLMAFLRDGFAAKLDFLETHRLLTPNTTNRFVGSGGLGYTSELPDTDAPVSTRDLWGFAESQETVGVSPAMFAEFILPYQLPLLERFGINCYGCCEPLDARWEMVKAIPRLRRVSVSPWANVERMAEALAGSFIYSRKPNPAHLATPEWHEEAARADVRATLQAAKRHGCHLELIMKDNHTLGGNPRNATRWCRMAREEIDRAFA